MKFPGLTAELLHLVVEFLHIDEILKLSMCSRELRKAVNNSPVNARFLLVSTQLGYISSDQNESPFDFAGKFGIQRLRVTGECFSSHIWLTSL